MAKQEEAWDKLSMLEKALLIKLSVDNGVSSLKLIRDIYNLYASGGNLAHKYDGELILEDLKMAFLQDWAYRYNNEAPTDTTTVVNAHNSVPLTIDDSILKQGLGGKYNPDTGVTLGRDTFNDNYAHEFSHALRRNIAGGLNSTTKENKELLNQAYPRFTVPLEKIIPSVITTEQLATNTEYRSEISKRAGNLWGKELDTYIDNMSQAELLAGVGTNGYIFGQNVPFTRTSYIGREATRKLLEEYKSLLDITDEQKLKEWYGYTLEDRNNRIKELELVFESGFTEEDRQQAEALRKALKTIAYNTTNPFEVSNNTYLAAFGGPLVHKKSTGGPLYPFSFEKNPYFKTPVVRYDEGGHLYGLGDWLRNLFTSDNTTEPVTTTNTEPASLDLAELASRQAYAESRFDSNAVSPANAIGLFLVTPNTLQYYNSKTGSNYTSKDLYDDTINQLVRDWYMNDLMNRPWNTKNNPSDSVLYAKSLAAYNWGPTNLVNTLNTAKANGIDIYNSWDWLPYVPQETRDYINFVLRNLNNSHHRNNSSYNRATDRYLSKVSAIKSSN